MASDRDGIWTSVSECICVTGKSNSVLILYLPKWHEFWTKPLHGHSSVNALLKHVLKPVLQTRLPRSWACGHAWEDLSAGSSGEQVCHLWALWDHTSANICLLLEDGSSNYDNRFVPHLCINIQGFLRPKKGQENVAENTWHIANLILGIVFVTVCPQEDEE